MKKYMVLVFIFFVKILHSQDNTVIIRNIKFEGLKRTKNSTMVNILHPIGDGSVYTSSTTNDIAQKLNSEHIFQPDITFDVVEEGNYVDITVYVKDRWTLIPLPRFSFSDNYWNVGAILIEENLFADYTSIGWEAGIKYKDKRFFMQNLHMDVSLFGGQFNILDFDMKNNTTNREYENLLFLSDITFKYQLLEELSLGGGIRHEYSGNIENKISTVGEVNSLGPYVMMEYKKATYEYPFEEGVAVRFNGGYQFSLVDDENYYSIYGEVNTSLILTEMQRIGGGIFAGYGDLPAQREFRVGGRWGAYTIPKAIIAADYYTSITAFYEIAFLDLGIRHKKPFATLSLQIFYEGGLYGSDILNNAWHHGPGAAVILYTPYVAAAALEFRYSYDIVNDNFYSSFAVSRYL